MFNKIFRYKLFLNGFWLLLVLILILSLCSIGFTQEQEKVKLTWSEWWDQEWGRDTIDWIISSFEEKHPNVEIETLFAPWDQYYNKVLSACQAGEVPDVMSMECMWASSFDKFGVFRDLEPLVASDSELKSHYSPSWYVWYRDRMIMNFLYVMPYQVAYNVKIFEKEGIKPPTNWEELRDCLRKFKDPDKGKYGMALWLSMKNAEQFTYYHFWSRLIQAGGRMIDDKGLALFNSTAGVRTLEYWKSLLDENLIYPGTTKGAFAIGEKEVNELFAAEQIPMVLTGPFIAPKSRESNPEIQVAFAPPFRDVTSGYMASGSGIALSSKSKHPELALEFFKHLLSNEVASKMVKEKSMSWANTAALESEVVKQDPILRYIPAMVSDPACQPLPVLPNMNRLAQVLLKNSQEYFLGEKDVRTALHDAEQEWNKIVQEE